MGLSSGQGRVCEKHPAHQEKKGVCPSCLSDRLFHLNHAAVGVSAAASVSSFINRDKAASAHSSAASSSSASSSHDDYHDTLNNNKNNKPTKEAAEEEKRVGQAHRRNASSSDIGSISCRVAAPAVSSRSVGGSNAGLKKCRSVAASYSFTPQPPKAISRRVDVGVGGGEKMFGNYYGDKVDGDGNYKTSGGGGDYGYGAGKKKKGFWTKLLHLKAKNKEVLIHHPAMAMKGRAY